VTNLFRKKLITPLQPVRRCGILLGVKGNQAHQQQGQGQNDEEVVYQDD